jgi:hypothetical protein
VSILTAVEHCEANGFHLLAITLAHITAVECLPFHHRDHPSWFPVLRQRHALRRHPLPGHDVAIATLLLLLGVRRFLSFAKRKSIET